MNEVNAETLIEMLDPYDGEVEWTGTLSSFLEANEGSIDPDNTVRLLSENGWLNFGGGAAALSMVRVVGGEIR